MKVVLVEFSPAGGLFQYTLQMADALARHGHDVEMLCGRHPELQPREPRVRLLPVLPIWHPNAGADRPAWWRRVRRVWRAALHLEAWRRVLVHLRRSTADVVQFSEWRFPVDAWAVLLVHRLVRPPVMTDVAHTPVPFTETGGDGPLHKSGTLLIRSLRRAYRRVDAVFVLGERSREGYEAAFPGAAPPVVIPHGDEGIYSTVSSGPAGQAPETVLFFGALARYKGLDLLLDAFAALQARRPSARLVVAGPVVDVDLVELRRRVDAQPGAELQDGYVPVGEVAALVGSARTLVTPYTVANQSGVIHLAHTLRRPVVTTDVGDLASAVGHGTSGLVVPPQDPASLAEALERLLADPDEATRLGDNGLAALADGCGWDNVAAIVTATYDTALGAAEPR